MKLTLLSPYGSKSQLLAHHIQQRLERPHVPLKFSAVYESDDHDYLVSVIRNPKDFVASEMLNHTTKQLHEHIESCKSFYNHSLVSANLMVEYDQIDKDINGIIGDFSRFFSASKIRLTKLFNKNWKSFIRRCTVTARA